MADIAVTPSAKEPLNQHFNDSDALEKNVAVNGKYEEVEGLTPRGKKFLFWTLSKKQWIAALVGSIVGVLAVVLVILFVAVVPAIFQGQVDNVVLTVNHMDLLKLSADPKVTDISVELSVHIAHDSMAAATMYETKAKLAYKGAVFGEVTLPETELQKGKHEFDLVIKGTSAIVDVAAFHEVSKAVVTEETFEISADADVKIKAMGLSYGGLSLKRTLTAKGLNQFSNPASQFNKIVVNTCTSSEFIMTTNITLENDSSIGLDGIGVLNMSVYHEQGYLGQAISLDGPKGIPRGKVPKMFELRVKKEAAQLKSMAALLKAIINNKAQFYISGNNPYSVKEAVLLTDALAKLNMSALYTHGLEPEYLTMNYGPECADLLALLTA